MKVEPDDEVGEGFYRASVLGCWMKAPRRFDHPDGFLVELGNGTEDLEDPHFAPLVDHHPQDDRAGHVVPDCLPRVARLRHSDRARARRRAWESGGGRRRFLRRRRPECRPEFLRRRHPECRPADPRGSHRGTHRRFQRSRRPATESRSGIARKAERSAGDDDPRLGSLRRWALDPDAASRGKGWRRSQAQGERDDPGPNRVHRAEERRSDERPERQEMETEAEGGANPARARRTSFDQAQSRREAIPEPLKPRSSSPQGPLVVDGGPPSPVRSILHWPGRGEVIRRPPPASGFAFFLSPAGLSRYWRHQTTTGAAMPIVEYVPAMSPTTRTKEKPRRTSLPEKNRGDDRQERQPGRENGPSQGLVRERGSGSSASDCPSSAASGSRVPGRR